MRFRIQYFLSMRIQIRFWIRINKGFDDQKLEKVYSWKYLHFLDQKLKFSYPYASIKDVKIQEKSFSLEREHLTLQNLNFLHFCGSFWPSWIRIQIRIPSADPDPADQKIRIRVRIRNTARYAFKCFHVFVKSQTPELKKKIKYVKNFACSFYHCLIGIYEKVCVKVAPILTRNKI